MAEISVSHETALCLIPPKHLWHGIDTLRCLYDKAYGRWPPHINLIYPFVRPESLDAAVERIGASFLSAAPGSLPIRLDSSGIFVHSRTNSNTKYLHDGDKDRKETLSALRTQVLATLGTATENEFTPHLTIGQSAENGSDEDMFLRHKIGFMPTVEWENSELCVLVRDRPSNGDGPGAMRLWGTISLIDGAVEREDIPKGFYPAIRPKGSKDAEEQLLPMPSLQKPAYEFHPATTQWTPFNPRLASSSLTPTPETISIASYNVLAEFTWPPAQTRYPLLAENIAASDADAIALQEVSDDFLCYLLSQPEIRKAYPYSSHGPPSQSDVDPLPSLLNLVVLSKHAFDWSWVPFSRQHKGTVVARFRDIGALTKAPGDTHKTFKPLILATVHLTCGLTDGSVTAKKAEVLRALNILRNSYPQNPAILAGDFNVATSTRSIDAARRRAGISANTTEVLASIEKACEQAGMIDAWTASRSGQGQDTQLLKGSRFSSDSGGIIGPAFPLRNVPRQADGSSDDEEDSHKDTFEGEQGATFDPTVNELAAQIVGSGLNNRPQRYDRIFVRGGFLRVAGFSLFGKKPSGLIRPVSFGRNVPSPLVENNEHTGMFASDHWGVRCLLRIGSAPEETKESEVVGKNKEPISEEIRKLIVPVELKRASPGLSDVGDLRSVLTDLGAIPSSEEGKQRQDALATLRFLLLRGDPGTDRATAVSSSALSNLLRDSLVTVPVGSYGIGVWSSTSDIDLLCIGPLSSRNFFALATQRLKKASASNPSIRLLRRVHARAGTMLELSINDVRMDLQYCPAAGIAASWPDALSLPPSDPMFSLPVTTLARLKAARDADYIRSSAPDCEAFQLAHRAIVSWAKSRGIYAARFGLLGGIQITLLLLRVCKLLVGPDLVSGETVAVTVKDLTVPDILTSFFAHYARFDFTRFIAFDPFYHRQRLAYTRSSMREPLSILGYFPPALNTAHAASSPSVRTIVEEFKLADEALSSGMSWAQFLGVVDADYPRAWSSPAVATDFLSRYKSYISIDLNYWGLTLARGSAFVGWVESRCVLLLVDLNRRAPGVHARIWPGRFVAVNENEGEAEGMDYQGRYLIGLDRVEGAEEQDPKIVMGAIQSALTRFEETIRRDELHFDATAQWMSANIVKRAELGMLAPDTREWGSYTPGDDDDSDEEEDEEDIDLEEALEHGDSESFPKKAKKPKKTKKSGKHNQAQTPSPPSSPPQSFEKKPRLRTAQDVLARLRWDPTLGGTVSAEDGGFIVGYEDRFTGIKERDLEEWKSESTHEEFIPMHRVLYFRRKGGDRGMVWDRKTRKDEVFGSGG